MDLVVLLALLFLKGINWINLDYSIPNVDNLSNQSTDQRNFVLSYFIITFITFIIAVLQYSRFLIYLVFRYLFKTWYPLPI